MTDGNNPITDRTNWAMQKGIF